MMVKRLTIAEWETIFNNLEEENEEVEISWLDPGDASEGEWALHTDCELFEDGFKTQQDAYDRLVEIEKAIDDNRGWQVLGYFTDRDNEDEELDYLNVLVIIEDTGLPKNRLVCYTPGDQHNEINWDYLYNQCEPISKDEYKEAGKNFYTPKEYL